MSFSFENYVIPGLICLILIVGLKKRVKVFDLFSDGVQEGLTVVYKLFPILLGLFMSVNLLRVSGLLEFISDKLSGLFVLFGIPAEIVSLVVLKPISGSATIAVGTDLMKSYGVDSLIGLTIATIMGATETTLYALAIYTGEIKKKISFDLLLLAIMGNFLGIIISSIICKLYFN